MGKRYHCEYCNRSFQDNITARKKHLQSLAHIRNRKEWYNRFKDKKTILEENLKKNPCNKFLSTGSCPFGDHCKYRHLNDHQLLFLKNEVESSYQQPILPPGDEIVRKWLALRKHTPDDKLDSLKDEIQSEQLINPELQQHQPLPPSLIPPPTGGWKYTCDDLTDWG